tara:strand:- start:353 stop:1531 length:1179 start_codon:yes stop_codon:yes gene_type:complete
MKDLLDKMKKLNENKNGKVITFDFDNTIVKSFENGQEGEENYQFGGLNLEIIKRIKKFKKAGATVLVVTSRHQAKEEPETSVKRMLDSLNLEVDGVFYTNGKEKAQKLYELGSTLHYDDDAKEHEAINAYRNLHGSFDISVKYPDELLSDTNEVAKGIILTLDGHFMIVQRSDSYEWDAVGGHLMEGEEGPFAFWREIKEETGLAVFDINHIGSMETVWKKKKKLVHYFIGYVAHTKEELKGAIELQWELADYFCGTFSQIEEKLKSPDGATHNLRNTVELMLKDRFLFEMSDFQKKMGRDHEKMKANLLRKGPNDEVPATGMKNVTKMKRSKSAPPGFGAMGEDKQPKKKRKLRIRLKESKKIKPQWPNDSSYDLFGSGPSNGGTDVSDGK